MKKRNRARGRRNRSSQQNFFQAFVDRARRVRKVWTFERLEDRFFMSATPLDTTYAQSLSSNTPEGAAAIALRELDWYNKLGAQSGGSSMIAPQSLPNDPYFQYQWNMLNTGGVPVNAGQIGRVDASGNPIPPLPQPIFGVAGQDINVSPVWDMGITGSGVLIAVNDTGVQLDHPDLADNISPLYRLDALDGDTNPTPANDTLAAHGTAVAGIIAAIQNNGIGTTGVAPGAQIAPVRMIATGNNAIVLTDQQTASALLLNGAPIDVSNNSWNITQSIPGFEREAIPLGPLTAQALQSLATQGRNGKGTVVVFAAGNDSGPITSPGFQNFGVWGTAGSSAYNNSRYTISVGIVDHDGSVNNSDGTQTLYGEVGPSTLVVAPSGSFAINVGSDTNTGSGITTTDTTGNVANGGFNVPPLANGLSLDSDFFPDTNYTTVFNGTSAAAPEVSGVVALMLQANPNLSYRDVEEILVRSARQNDPTDPSWVVNGNPLFRDPTAMADVGGLDPIGDPVGSPAVPLLFANGAGYTVSQGRTPQFGTEYGYAHGEVDAKLAVQLAQQWTTKNQTLAPEETWTTFINLPATSARHGETTNDDSGKFYIPGALGNPADPGFDAFFNEFFADMPFSETPPPANTRGGFIDVAVPPSNLMDVEWVEVKLDLASGTDSNALDFLRIALVSPDGTISDLTNYQMLPASIIDAFQTTPENGYDNSPGVSGFFVDPPGHLDPNTDGNGVFSWVYSTNRDWGERSDLQPLLTSSGAPAPDPITGAPFKGWELHFENYSAADIGLDGYEIVFHGHPLAPNTERIQGNVGVDAGVAGQPSTRNDGNFNFNRYIDDPVLGRIADPNQEPFAGNVTVKATPTGFNGKLTAAGSITGITTSASFSTTTLTDASLIGKTVLPQAGDLITITSGPDVGLVRTIAAFDATTGTITLSTALPQAEANGTTYKVNKTHLVDSGLIGQALQPTVGDSIKIGSETHTITAYDKLTGTMTIDSPFTTAPSSGAAYTITIAAPKVLAQFITGADGNYYFDLPPGTYQLTQSNTIGTNGASLQAKTQTDPVTHQPVADPLYNSTWTVTIDPNDAFTRIAGTKDSKGKFVELNQLNFLLDPGLAPPAQISVSGKVYVDINSNGIQDANDPAAKGSQGFFAYVDANKDGSFEAGEQPVILGEDGTYTFTIPTSVKDTFQIGVVSPAGWTATNPVSALHSVYGGPGDNPFTGLDFAFAPPPGAVVGEPGAPGSILGQVYNDANQNGMQDGGEIGVNGIHVFVDVNHNSTFDSGEPDATTDVHGAFLISNVTPGTVSVVAEVHTPYSLTQPASGARTVTLLDGGVASNVLFGVQNLATRDFGDLGAPYPTLLADNGPRNSIVPGFQLGTKIDGEVDGQPSADAKGDDAVGGDEDGVKILDAQGQPGGSLHLGTNTLQITVQGVGGYLNGWIDWNGNGSWLDSGDQVFKDLHLNPGTYQLTVTSPPDVTNGALAARFRWGSAGASFTGPDIIGETEDYRLANSILLGDFNHDGTVNTADYNLWVSTFGSTFDLRADGNHNGVVDAGDYSVWRDNMGQASGGAGAGAGVGAGAGSAAATMANLDGWFPPAAPAVSRKVLSLSDQLAYIRSLGIDAYLVQAGDSYHIGVKSSNGGAAAGVGAGSVTTAGLSTTGSGGSDSPVASVAHSIDLALLQFSTNESPAVSPSAFATSGSVGQGTSESNLLLIDHALTDMGAPRAVGEGNGLLSLLTDSDSQTDSHENDQLSDLSLAAVFDNDTDWRNVI